MGLKDFFRKVKQTFTSLKDEIVNERGALSDGPQDEELRKQLFEGSSAYCASLLRLSRDDHNFLTQVPEMFRFDLKEHLPDARYALRFDPNLEEVRARLVPARVKELEFWRRYFYHVYKLRSHTPMPSDPPVASSRRAAPQSRSNAGEVSSPVPSDLDAAFPLPPGETRPAKAPSATASASATAASTAPARGPRTIVRSRPPERPFELGADDDDDDDADGAASSSAASEHAADDAGEAASKPDATLALDDIQALEAEIENELAALDASMDLASPAAAAAVAAYGSAQPAATDGAEIDQDAELGRLEAFWAEQQAELSMSSPSAARDSSSDAAPPSSS